MDIINDIKTIEKASDKNFHRKINPYFLPSLYYYYCQFFLCWTNIVKVHNSESASSVAIHYYSTLKNIKNLEKPSSFLVSDIEKSKTLAQKGRAYVISNRNKKKKLSSDKNNVCLKYLENWMGKAKCYNLDDSKNEEKTEEDNELEDVIELQDKKDEEKFEKEIESHKVIDLTNNYTVKNIEDKRNDGEHNQNYNKLENVKENVSLTSDNYPSNNIDNSPNQFNSNYETY